MKKEFNNFLVEEEQAVDRTVHPLEADHFPQFVLVDTAEDSMADFRHLHLGNIVVDMVVVDIPVEDIPVVVGHIAAPVLHMPVVVEYTLVALLVDF